MRFLLLILLAGLSLLPAAAHPGTLLWITRPSQPGPSAQTFRQQLDSLQILADFHMYPMAVTQTADKARRQLDYLQRTRGEQDPATVAALETLSDLYQRFNKHKEAEPLLRQLVAYRQSHPGVQSRAYARALRSLALVLATQEHYAEAQVLNQKARTVLKEQAGERDPQYQQALGEEAFIWMHQEVSRDLSAFPRQLYQAYERSSKGQYVDYVEMMDFVADWFYQSDLYEEIDSLNRRLLPILGKQVGERHPRYVAVQERMGDVQRDLRQYAAAEKTYRQVLEQRKRLVGPRHTDYARVLYSLGFVCEATKRYAQAAPLYQEAVDVLQGQARTYEEQCMFPYKVYALVAVYRYLGRPADALRAQQLVLTLWLALGNADEEIRRETEVARGTLHTLLASLPPADPALATTGWYYDRLLASRGQRLASAINLRRLGTSSADTAITHQFTRWQRSRQQVARASMFTAWQQRQRGLNLERATATTDSLEAELTSRVTSPIRDDQAPLTWRQVQRQLRPGEVAMEVVRFNWNVLPKPDTMTFRQMNRYIYAEDNYQIMGPATYAAYLLTPANKFPQVVVLRNGEALEKEFREAYRRSARAPRVQHRGAVMVVDSSATPIKDSALFTAFWQPIARQLPSGTHTLFYSPDGVYHEVNPATLLNPATGKYVLEELDLRLVGSTREVLQRALLAPLGSVPAGKSAAAVLVGAPTYRSQAQSPQGEALSDAYKELEYKSTGESFRETLNIPALPGTSQEVDEIAALLSSKGWQATRHTGKTATEEQVRAVRRPHVLHLATHGFVLPHENLVISATEVRKAAEEGTLGKTQFLDLSDKQTDFSPNIAKQADPLLRAGLLLSGVEDFRELKIKPAGEDGLLTAYEASLMDLQGTELVVLSACETGLGEAVPEEGLFGLRQGFVMAGARAVLVSLWHVDDAVTRELMTAFYRNWLGGQPKRAALRAAQQAVSRTHPDPYYWGAFVLFGE